MGQQNIFSVTANSSSASFCEKKFPKQLEYCLSASVVAEIVRNKKIIFVSSAKIRTQ